MSEEAFFTRGGGAVTTGEARTMVACILGDDPENISAYVVVAVKKEGDDLIRISTDECRMHALYLMQRATIVILTAEETEGNTDEHDW